MELVDVKLIYGKNNDSHLKYIFTDSNKNKFIIRVKSLDELRYLHYSNQFSLPKYLL